MPASTMRALSKGTPRPQRTDISKGTSPSWSRICARAPRAVAAAVRDKADELLEAVGDYRAVWGRSVAFTEPLRNIDGRSVPGIDTVSDLIRMLEPLELPAPLPDPTRRRR